MRAPSNVLLSIYLILCVGTLTVSASLFTPADELLLSGYNVGHLVGDSTDTEDGFGASMCIDPSSGYRLVVGAPYENNNLGAAYIYNWTSDGLNWQRELKITPPDTIENKLERFGEKVVVDQRMFVVFGVNTTANPPTYEFLMHYFAESNHPDWSFFEAVETPCQASYGIHVEYKNNILLIVCKNIQGEDYLWRLELDANTGEVGNRNPLAYLRRPNETNSFCSATEIDKDRIVVGDIGSYHVFPSVGLSSNFVFEDSPDSCVQVTSTEDLYILAAEDKPNNFSVYDLTDTLIQSFSVNSLATSLHQMILVDGILVVSTLQTLNGVQNQFMISAYVMKSSDDPLWSVGPPTTYQGNQSSVIAVKHNSYAFSVLESGKPGAVWYILNETELASIYHPDNSTAGPDLCLSTLNALRNLKEPPACDSQTGVWTVIADDGSNVTNVGGIVVEVGEVVNIYGNFIHPKKSTILLTRNELMSVPSLNVYGDLYAAGKLVVRMNFDPLPTIPTDIITCNQTVYGSFSAVAVRNDLVLTFLCGLKSKVGVKGINFNILASPASCDKHNVSRGVIIGVATGVGTIIIILLVLGIAMAIFVYRNGFDSLKRLVKGPRSQEARSRSFNDEFVNVRPASSRVQLNT